MTSADGRIVASTEVFNRLIGADAIATPAVGAAISAITSGGQELVGADLETADGRRFDARVEAVIAAGDQRLALIATHVPRPPEGADAVPQWFGTFVEDSVAIVWLKDLNGRYTYINHEYTAQLGAEPAQVCGHDDHELNPLEAIDGPRVKSAVRSGVERRPGPEPLQLEYTIPSFDRRPAFAALRFPVRTPAGEPLAVCGVASPAERGEIALNACEHLLEVLQWFRGDPHEIRASVMRKWGLTAVRPDGMEIEASQEVTASAAELADAEARAQAAERATAALQERLAALQEQLSREHGRALDLEGSLADARGRADALGASLEVANLRAATLDAAQARIRELESMVATASSAGVAAAETARRVTELESEARSLGIALEQERAERDALESSIGQGQLDIEAERARHASALENAEQAYREQIEARLAHVHQQHAAELRGLQASHASELEALREELEHLRADEGELQALRDAEQRYVGEIEALQESERRYRAELETLRDAQARHAGELDEARERHAAELREAEARHQADRESVAEWHQGELRGAEERRQTDLRELADRLRSESTGDDAAHRAEIDLLKRLHQEELVAVREQQAFELTAAHDREMAELRESYEHRQAAHADHEQELSEAQSRVRTELNAANQRHQVELDHLREQHAAQLAGSAHAVAQTGTQLSELREQLTHAEGQIGELQNALAASRDHITRLERAAAAATAAAASPIYPTFTPHSAPPPVAQPQTASVPGPLTPPAQAPEAPPAAPLAPAAQQPTILSDQPLLIGDDPRPEPRSREEIMLGLAQSASMPRQPGWDPAAQQALTDALRGCLNLRSILSESVRLIGTGGSWDAVVAWVYSEREEKYSCAATWVRSPVEMARLETSMWQVRQSPTESAIGRAATSTEIVWINDPGADGDRHMANVRAEGMNTVVLMPVSQQGTTFAVLELCTEGLAGESPQAEAALRSIEVEIGTANQRLVDSATSSQWGRRRR